MQNNHGIISQLFFLVKQTFPFKKDWENDWPPLDLLRYQDPFVCSSSDIPKLTVPNKVAPLPTTINPSPKHALCQEDLSPRPGLKSSTLSQVVLALSGLNGQSSTWSSFVPNTLHKLAFWPVLFNGSVQFPELVKGVFGLDSRNLIYYVTKNCYVPIQNLIKRLKLRFLNTVNSNTIFILTLNNQSYCIIVFLTSKLKNIIHHLNMLV